MALIKKVAKGTLAVGTLGASVAVEKGARAAARGVSGKVETQEDLSPEDIAAGVIFRGMSHDTGRNAQVTLYADRIERVRERSRASFSKAHQEVEVTPIRTVSSVQAQKDGFYTKVTLHAVGNPIEFRLRHEHAALFRDQVQRLVLDYDRPSAAGPAPPGDAAAAMPDPTDQLRKLAELRDLGVISPDEFESKKAELLSRL